MLTPAPHLESTIQQVKASAGSGKTFALTQFFLALVRSSQPAASPSCGPQPAGAYSWPEILAITFTNKAAAEMQQRVVTSLKERALGQGADGPAGDWTPSEASRWLQRLIRHYHQLNIRTIDSLLHLIMRLCALDLGLPPDFTVAFDTRPVFEPLYDAFLHCAQDQDSPERQLLETALQHHLASPHTKGLLGNRTITNQVKRVFDFLLTQDAPVCTDGAQLDAALQRLAGELRAAGHDLEQLIHSHNLTPHQNFAQFLTNLSSWQPPNHPPDSKYLAKPGLLSCLKKISHSQVTPAAERAFTVLQELYATHVPQLTLLAKALRWLPLVQWATLLLQGLPAFQQQQGVVLGLRWARDIQTLLTAGPALALLFCRLGAAPRYLLIDEFQDTSQDQFNALVPLIQECLAAGGSLFYVGDVKQAIYGWREGDWRLFDAVAGLPHLASLAPVRQTHLPRNWRSHRHLVEFLNRFFGQLRQEQPCRQVAAALLGDGAAPWEATLADTLQQVYQDVAQQIAPPRQATTGYVSLHRLCGTTKEELALQVKENLQPLLEDISRRRPWSDIAILVRTNAEAQEVSLWLIGWGIPLITENSLHLAEHPLINQILAFLSFLDHPGDHLAFINFLLSPNLFLPVSSLTTADILDWLAGNPPLPLHRSFRDAFPALWHQYIHPFYRQSGLMRPYDLVHEILNHFAVLRHQPQHEIFLRRFLEILHRAEEIGCLSLAEFFTYWQDLGVQEKVPLPEDVNAVRVLTIHKAKGLEFPVVIAPFHNWSPSQSRLGTVAWPPDRLLVPLEKAYGPDYYHPLLDGFLEDVNLLYVCWTRAIAELYAFIPADPGTSPLGKALQVLIQELDWSPADPAWHYGHLPPPSPVVPPCLPGPLTVSPTPAGASEDYLPMDWLPRLQIFHNPLDQTQETERHRGELFHRALEYLPPHDDSGAAIHRAVNLALATATIASLPAPDLAHQMQDRLHWLLSFPDLSRWLRQGRPEVEIMAADGSLHRLDRLIIDAGTAIVLEYKTGREAPAHLDQVRRYLSLLAAMPALQAATPPVTAFCGVLLYLDLKTRQEVFLSESVANLQSPDAMEEIT